MPFLSLVHLRELRCQTCGAELAAAGARSVVIDAEGYPKFFPEDDAPREMRVCLACPSGHPTELFVPNEISAEEALATPDEAPLGADAAFVEGTAESGRAL